MSKQKKIDWAELQKPIVLGPDEWENSNYLLMRELKTAFDRIEEFSRIHSETRENEFEIPMNIGIFGERGSGKTSLLKSLKNKLEAEKYYVFDIIDPNTLSSDLNILEIVITNIYQYIIHQNIEDPYLIERIISKLKRIMSALAIKRQKEDYLKKDNPSIDMLDKVNDIVKLDVLIVELLNEFKEILKKERKCRELKDLVLIIDDLDLLENKYISKLISEIHEYLNTKLIIVFACRNRQLQDSVLEEKLGSNKELLEKRIIDIAELKNQVDSILMKLIPMENRINLFEQTDLMEQSYIDVLESLGILEGQRKENELNIDIEEDYSVESWIYHQIQQATRLYIKPLDEKETVNLFLPKTLREFIQFAEMISKILTYNGEYVYRTNNDRRTDDKRKILNKFVCLDTNIQSFRKYFIEKSSYNLSKEAKDLIDGWYFVDSHQKNYLTFHYFFNKISWGNDKGKKIVENDYFKEIYPLKLSLVENHNIRLGDVFKVMELYKTYDAKTPFDFFEVYVMKVLYSLELTSLVSRAFNIEKNRFLKNASVESSGISGEQIDSETFVHANVAARKYLDLVNVGIMPGEHKYFENESRRKDEFYTFVYNSENVPDDFVEDFVSSPITVYSDVRKGIFRDKSAFAYRELYSYWEFDRNGQSTPNSQRMEIENKRRYYFEFFVSYVKARYFQLALVDYINYFCYENEEDMEHGLDYIFHSIFQIDNLIRVNYSRKEVTQAKRFYYTVEAIRRIFQTINGEEQIGYIKTRYFKALIDVDDFKYKIPSEISLSTLKEIFDEEGVVEAISIQTDGKLHPKRLYVKLDDADYEAKVFYDNPNRSTFKENVRKTALELLDHRRAMSLEIEKAFENVQKIAEKKGDYKNEELKSVINTLQKLLRDEYGIYGQDADGEEIVSSKTEEE
ncbi:MAG: hypothetical protein Q4B43_10025 [Bacteroidota bacterium]|nr:hypothetical protein [Bacteroidota bacterium]